MIRRLALIAWMILLGLCDTSAADMVEYTATGTFEDDTEFAFHYIGDISLVQADLTVLSAYIEESGAMVEFNYADPDGTGTGWAWSWPFTTYYRIIFYFYATNPEGLEDQLIYVLMDVSNVDNSVILGSQWWGGTYPVTRYIASGQIEEVAQVVDVPALGTLATVIVGLGMVGLALKRKELNQ